MQSRATASQPLIPLGQYSRLPRGFGMVRRLFSRLRVAEFVMKASWDIFCSVVDNYGDIGVTWRLARQLATEHGQTVRLWVDELAAFARLCPGADPAAARQWLLGVEVCHWPRPWLPLAPADLVVEAFACQLPCAYIEAMAARAGKGLWLNLEYLSAENWVGGCHGLPSLQSNGLQKFFFFPGFTADTGGVLRERDLLARRRAFQADAGAQARFLQSLGVQRVPEARLISLFAYENTALASWLEVLARGARPSQLLVPEGRILGDLAAWLGVPGLRAGDRHSRGALSLQVLPFIQQEAYDLLLWSCDFNAVRGEDSFLRALWAGRPLLWHLYRQDEGAHWDKLEAFLNLYLEGVTPAVAQALSALWRAWNAGEDMAGAWDELLEAGPAVSEHAECWVSQLAVQSDLATQLMEFCTQRSRP